MVDVAVVTVNVGVVLGRHGHDDDDAEQDESGAWWSSSWGRWLRCYPLCYAAPHPKELRLQSKLFGFRKTSNGNWPPSGSYGWHPLISMVRKSQKPARHTYKHQPLLCCHAEFKVFAFVPSNAFIVTILYKRFSLYQSKIFIIFQVDWNDRVCLFLLFEQLKI